MGTAETQEVRIQPAILDPTAARDCRMSSGRSFRASKWTRVGLLHVRCALLLLSAMRLKKSSEVGNALLPMLPQDQTSGVTGQNRRHIVGVGRPLYVASELE